LKTCETTITETKVAKLRVEPKTIGTADIKRIDYVTMLVASEWQTQHFIQTTSCEAYSHHHKQIRICVL